MFAELCSCNAFAVQMLPLLEGGAEHSAEMRRTTDVVGVSVKATFDEPCAWPAVM